MRYLPLVFLVAGCAKTARGMVLCFVDVDMLPFCQLPQAYYMLDEIMLAGELQEPSKKLITRNIEAQDSMVQEAKSGGPSQGQSAVPGLSGR